MAKNIVSKKGKIQDKKSFKKIEGKCRLCGCDIYSTLDIHRIKPGEKDGKYSKDNVIVIDSNCHRRIHDGEIIIDRYYLCSNGKKLLRIIRDGKEEFI